MNCLLELKFFILGHPVTSKQPHKIVQIHLRHPVGSHFNTMCFPDIYGIYATNTFEQGVGIQASRFNHSCRSNAEEFWNEKYGATEIRSVSKINAGEEITINYRTSEISMKSYKIRLVSTYLGIYLSYLS